MARMTDEARMRAIAEAVMAERMAQLRRELETGEIARLRSAMEAGFARLTASIETLTHAQQRTQAQLDALTARVDSLAARVEALAEAQRRTEARLEALTARVDALAEAQHRTEARLEVLTARIDALAEAQQRTEARLEALAARVDALAEAQRRTETSLEALAARVDGLAEAQRQTEARLQALAAQMQALTAQVQALTQTVSYLTRRVGNLSGQILEAEFGRKAASYVGRLLRKAKAFAPSELEDVLEPHLTADELEDWSRADWVVVGRPRGEPADRPDVHLVVEVSGQVQVSDVVRAARRAGYLRRAGFDARGCVFGHEIAPEALDTARSMGVLVFQDGHWMDVAPASPDSNSS